MPTHDVIDNQHERLIDHLRTILPGAQAAALMDQTDDAERLNEEAMYTICGEGEIGRYEEDEVDEFVDLNEAEEIIRQLREDQPELYRRITSLRDGIRCGRRTEQEGAVVLCRAGDYKQLYLADEQGEILSRDVPRILNILKCEPDTPAEPLPPGYNATVMRIKGQFDREVEARNAERQHTLSLTRAQQYVLRELRVLHAEREDEDVRGQIQVLEAAFRQPVPRPVVRSELNRLRREGLTGDALLRQLTRVYALHGLDAAPSSQQAAADENNALPRIVCSEGLII